MRSLMNCFFTDTSGELLKGINSYRVSLNLSALTENQNAECLAEQLAEQFQGQECSNTTGSNTVPGTEQQFPNYPDFLNHCHLNATVTRDAAIMPACIPSLAPDLVLSNFTKSQYSRNLNDGHFVGAGIADEGDWVVVVLSTNTPTGSFAPATGVASVVKVAIYHQLVLFLLGFFIVMMS
ncbi:putative GPI-anchored protein [Cocos nucifera]|uniref:Putative GPI-anchored protein n=1 Tax=Cocos nucifera TaxID=13894 RepID=A0A8K0HWZ9_COCNU|nr:putative GPI-anchored protein [Cocos nucifera]